MCCGSSIEGSRQVRTIQPVVQHTKRQTVRLGLASRPAHGLIGKDLTRLLEATAVQVDDAELLAKRLLPPRGAIRGLLGELKLESAEGLVLGLVDLDARRVDLLDVGLANVVVVLLIARDLDRIAN